MRATMSSGEWEVVPLAGGGSKRRKLKNKQWQYRCKHNRQRSTCKDCGGGSICEHGRRRSRCKECGGRPPSHSSTARRASPRAAGAGGAARKGAAEDSGYETATYVDEDAADYARPRKRRTVVKEEAADDDQGYDTATYVKGSNEARAVARAKVKREEDRDRDRD